MGCSCYNAKAATAKSKMKKLKEEKEKYENLSNDIDVAKSALESYASFLRSLGEQCKSICVTGEPYDLGYCATHASSIDSLNTSTLDPMKISITNAISDIDKEITSQQEIINNEFYCNSCYDKKMKNLKLKEERLLT